MSNSKSNNNKRKSDQSFSSNENGNGFEASSDVTIKHCPTFGDCNDIKGFKKWTFFHWLPWVSTLGEQVKNIITTGKLFGKDFSSYKETAPDPIVTSQRIQNAATQEFYESAGMKAKVLSFLDEYEFLYKLLDKNGASFNVATQGVESDIVGAGRRLPTQEDLDEIREFIPFLNWQEVAPAGTVDPVAWMAAQTAEYDKHWPLFPKTLADLLARRSANAITDMKDYKKADVVDKVCYQLCLKHSVTAETIRANGILVGKTDKEAALHGLGASLYDKVSSAIDKSTNDFKKNTAWYDEYNKKVNVATAKFVGPLRDLVTAELNENNHHAAFNKINLHYNSIKMMKVGDKMAEIKANIKLTPGCAISLETLLTKLGEEIIDLATSLAMASHGLANNGSYVNFTIDAQETIDSGLLTESAWKLKYPDGKRWVSETHMIDLIMNGIREAPRFKTAMDHFSGLNSSQKNLPYIVEKLKIYELNDSDGIFAAECKTSGTSYMQTQKFDPTSHLTKAGDSLPAYGKTGSVAAGSCVNHPKSTSHYTKDCIILKDGTKRVTKPDNKKQKTQHNTTTKKGEYKGRDCTYCLSIKSLAEAGKWHDQAHCFLDPSKANNRDNKKIPKMVHLTQSLKNMSTKISKLEKSNKALVTKALGKKSKKTKMKEVYCDSEGDTIAASSDSEEDT